MQLAANSEVTPRAVQRQLLGVQFPILGCYRTRLLHRAHARDVPSDNAGVLLPARLDGARSGRCQPRILLAAYASQYARNPPIHVGRSSFGWRNLAAATAPGPESCCSLRPLSSLRSGRRSLVDAPSLVSRASTLTFSLPYVSSWRRRSSPSKPSVPCVRGVLINRLFVAVAAVNCCSSPLASAMYPDGKPRARSLCLVLDITLDYVSSVGVPSALLVPCWGNVQRLRCAM